MKNHNLILLFFLSISTGCLGIVYLLAGYWPVLLIFLVLLLVWGFTNRFSKFWSTSLFLITYLGLAAIGIMLDLPLILMLIAGSTALVSWELIQFKHDLSKDSIDALSGQRETYNLHSLLIAASTGFTLTLLSANITLQFPFIVTIFLVLVGLECLTQGLKQIKKN